MSKWTPGPWHRTGALVGKVINDKKDQLIADCNFKPYNEEGRKVSAANASLIAAAPELYEACRYIVEAGETGDEITAIEKASAALAKARGEV